MFFKMLEGGGQVVSMHAFNLNYNSSSKAVLLRYD